MSERQRQRRWKKYLKMVRKTEEARHDFQTMRDIDLYVVGSDQDPAIVRERLRRDSER